MSLRQNRLPNFQQAVAAPTVNRPSGTKVSITPTTLNGPIFWRWYFQQWEALALAELVRLEQAGVKGRGNRIRTVKAGQ
jgi:hypothetical protein